MRIQLLLFLCLLKSESGDFGFVVGHYLFIIMASSWWYFTYQLLFHLLPYGREIFLGPSLAKPISRSLIVLADSLHCIHQHYLHGCKVNTYSNLCRISVLEGLVFLAAVMITSVATQIRYQSVLYLSFQNQIKDG